MHITTRENTINLSNLLVQHSQVCRRCQPNYPCEIKQQLKSDVAWSAMHEAPDPSPDRERIDAAIAHGERRLGRMDDARAWGDAHHIVREMLCLLKGKPLPVYDPW